MTSQEKVHYGLRQELCASQVAERIPDCAFDCRRFGTAIKNVLTIILITLIIIRFLILSIATKI